MPDAATAPETVILADGEYPAEGIPATLLAQARYVVCCDGAADAYTARGGIPSAIVGDGDSIGRTTAQRFRDILHIVPDQETNDLTKAFSFCMEQGRRELTILGATGGREDHAIGNIALLADYARQAGQPPENMNTPPVILAIAGSDPSGGAGIQADIKTVSALGGYAAAAVTAITVQNTRGVAQVEYLSPETVGRQCGAVIEDLSPDAVKIGMTGTPAIISAIAEVLERYGCRNVVFDPVALSTSGKILTQPDALETACNRLFPLCRVVTPNLPEASLLTGEPITDEEEMRRAARLLHERYGCAFLIKGGHLDADRPTDILYDGRMYAYTADRIETSNLHGTGCTLSSAIATLLGRGLPLETAVGRAKEYVTAAIEAARTLQIGRGNGPLWHFPGKTDDTQ